MAFLKYIHCLLQAENTMTGRAYIGEVLTQVWLKSVRTEMSELFDKHVNVQKEKSFRGSRKLPQAHEKSVR